LTSNNNYNNNSNNSNAFNSSSPLISLNPFDGNDAKAPNTSNTVNSSNNPFDNPFVVTSSSSPSSSSSPHPHHHSKEPATFYIKSAGRDSGNFAEIKINNNPIVMKSNTKYDNRGFHCVIMNEEGNEVEYVYVYDTSDINSKDSELLANTIDELPSNRIVLLAVKDDASRGLTEHAKKAIEDLGASHIRSLLPNGSYALIGRKGATKGSVHEEIENFGATTSMTISSATVKGLITVPIPTQPPLSKFMTTPDSNPDEGESCVVCLEQPRTYAFVPCGHRCVCDRCASDIYNKHLQECPLCRSPFNSMVKIF